VARAYKATPTRKLETETFVPPIDIHLNSLTARFHKRLEESGQAAAIRQACDAITWRLRSRRGRQTARKPTLGKLRNQWTDAWTKQAKDLLGAEQPRQHQQRPRACPAPSQAVLAHRKSRWKAKESRADRDRGIDASAGPSQARLKLHDKLQKAESAVLIQARTGCIGLAQFLRHRKVPDVATATCECGYGPETTKHVVVHYALVDEESRH